MTFAQIIWAFPLAAIVMRLVVESWCRDWLFSGARAWLETRRGNWWADILCVPSGVSFLLGAALTIAMFASMEGLNGSYAQFAMLYAWALIQIPEFIVRFPKRNEA